MMMMMLMFLKRLRPPDVARCRVKTQMEHPAIQLLKHLIKSTLLFFELKCFLRLFEHRRTTLCIFCTIKFVLLLQDFAKSFH